METIWRKKSQKLVIPLFRGAFPFLQVFFSVSKRVSKEKKNKNLKIEPKECVAQQLGQSRSVASLSEEKRRKAKKKDEKRENSLRHRGHFIP